MQDLAVATVPLHGSKNIVADLVNYLRMFCSTAIDLCSGQSKGRRAEFMTALSIIDTVSEKNNPQIRKTTNVADR